MSNTVIQVEELSKRYQLGMIGYGSLQHDFRAWWAKARGRDDPNATIGQESRLGRYGEFWALRNVGFQVEGGDRLGIIGRNGAGKSTLLKLLSRVTGPTSGRIRVRGRIASLLEVGTGFHPELSGRENVFLNGAILGMKRREIQAKFDEIVSFAGVEKFIETPVKRYSSGMYVRLAFSVAAHLDSEILIVDEVLAVGDTDFQRKCLGKMEDVSKGQGRTVLFVSHNLSAMKTLCNKGILLANGSIIEKGTISQTLNAYSVQGVAPDSSGAWSYPEDETLPFQVIEARLLKTDEGFATTFEADEVFFLELYCLSRKPITGLYGYLNVSNQDFHTVLTCDSQENGPNPFSGLPVGHHKIRISFPARLLGTGRYSVYLNFTSQYHSGTVHNLGDSIRFSIVDTHTARGEERGAILSTLLPWTKIESS